MRGKSLAEIGRAPKWFSQARSYHISGTSPSLRLTPPAGRLWWPPMNEQTHEQTQTKAKAGAIIVPVTLFEQNCTIIWCEATKKAVVIDPGGDVPKIQEAIKQT